MFLSSNKTRTTPRDYFRSTSTVVRKLPYRARNFDVDAQSYRGTRASTVARTRPLPDRARNDVIDYHLINVKKEFKDSDVFAVAHTPHMGPRPLTRKETRAVLFGLYPIPCLYDTDYQSSGLTYVSVMSVEDDGFPSPCLEEALGGTLDDMTEFYVAVENRKAFIDIVRSLNVKYGNDTRIYHVNS